MGILIGYILAVGIGVVLLLVVDVGREIVQQPEVGPPEHIVPVLIAFFEGATVGVGREIVQRNRRWDSRGT